MSVFRLTRAIRCTIAATKPQVFRPATTKISAQPWRALTQTQRSMSDRFQEKESSQEKDFVSRQEREALKSMLHKMERDADPGFKKALAALEDKLAASGVKVSDKLKKDLLEWRHTAH